MQYLDGKNYGLGYNFFVTDEGKLSMLGGPDKAIDNINFWLGFTGWFRVYYETFCPELLGLIQKPTSLVNGMKTLILGRLMECAQKYLPFVKVKSMDLTKIQSRKDYALGIVFDYNLESDVQLHIVSFIQV